MKTKTEDHGIEDKLTSLPRGIAGQREIKSEEEVGWSEAAEPSSMSGRTGGP